MAIDPYALCPGGTGKKIKFCCPDLMGELDELLTMVEGDQHVAALREIERLEQKGSPRACLLATKVRLLRVLDRLEDAAAAAATFIEHFPDNPIALAESAIQQAIGGQVREAVEQIQRALAVRDEIAIQVYDAMGIVAQVLLADGHVGAARALWQLQMLAHGEDSRPASALFELGRSQYVPLLLKDDPLPAECPKNAPWKARFEKAMEPIHHAHWLAGAEQLAALAQDVPDAPAVWHNLALVRSWLADKPGTVEALRRFAALDVPREDAVEAEATAILLSEDGLGDSVETVREVYTVEDVEHLVAVFSTCKQAAPITINPRQFEEEDEVPPKAAFHVTDRPELESLDAIQIGAIPSVIGQLQIFGRQTDRPARLVAISTSPQNRRTLAELLQSLAGQQIVGQPESEELGRTSASRAMLRQMWRLPPGVTREQVESLVYEHLQHVLLNQWPEQPLGLLDGQSPRQAAAEPRWQIKLLAAIFVVEIWTRQSDERFDFNLLRTKLGLPVLEPIDPDLVTVDKLPLVRLHRVMADKLSDESLLGCFRRASAFGVGEALGRLAQVLVDRPGIPPLERADGFRALAQLEHDSDRALAQLDRGRQMVESAGQSSAAWDLMELGVRTERGEVDEIRRLVDHIQRDHIREPGVGESLVRFLVSIGAIRPDGTPAAGQAEPAAAELPAESAGLWTPDGPAPRPAAPASASPDRPKIWTPGMD